MAATERISEAWLEPVLETMLRQFPCRILGFHSDNGSEFINRVVARLLNQLLIEQTKSRPRHSNDNGLAETQNGALIRQPMGYAYIPAGHAHAAVLHRPLQSLSQLPSSLRPVIWWESIIGLIAAPLLFGTSAFYALGFGWEMVYTAHLFEIQATLPRPWGRSANASLCRACRADAVIFGTVFTSSRRCDG